MKTRFVSSIICAMYTNRLFHDEGSNVFHNETMVYFSQCGNNKQLSLSELLRLTSDTAVEDYRERGMSRDVLLQNNYAILVSRVAFRFHSLPRENQRVAVSTWEEKPEPVQLVRAYEIAAEDGAKLVSGLSTWLVVNPATRRIVPTKEFTMRPEPVASGKHDCLKPGKIIAGDDLELWDERTVKLSDIDGNNHTNNSRYGAFVEDALPADCRALPFTDFRLNYSKEATLGQKLLVYGKNDTLSRKLTVVGRAENRISFEAELYYASR